MRCLRNISTNVPSHLLLLRHLFSFNSQFKSRSYWFSFTSILSSHSRPVLSLFGSVISFSLFYFVCSFCFLVLLCLLFLFSFFTLFFFAPVLVRVLLADPIHPLTCTDHHVHHHHHHRHHHLHRLLANPVHPLTLSKDPGQRRALDEELCLHCLRFRKLIIGYLNDHDNDNNDDNNQDND